MLYLFRVCPIRNLTSPHAWVWSSNAYLSLDPYTLYPEVHGMNLWKDAWRSIVNSVMYLAVQLAAKNPDFSSTKILSPFLNSEIQNNSKKYKLSSSHFCFCHVCFMYILYMYILYIYHVDIMRICILQIYGLKDNYFYACWIVSISTLKEWFHNKINIFSSFGDLVSLSSFFCTLFLNSVNELFLFCFGF